MTSKAFVTGAAGFIGSQICERLVQDGYEVTGWDNFSTGRQEFLATLKKDSRFRLVEGDNLDAEALKKAARGSEIIFHLAANADVRFGLNHPNKDLQQNTVATFNVLEAARANKIRRIVFSSTGSVYGEAAVIPTPENAPFPVQTSMYGASKLAGEGLLAAYAEGYGMQAFIFRFVSILGERYTHGHVFDFYKQLLEHPDHLQVLGDGTQRKSYLYIQDCVAAISHVLAHHKLSAKGETHIYNLGTDEYCRVKDSIGWICEELGLKPRLEFSGGDRGWIGDNPFIFLDTKKIQSTGWRARVTIRDAVVKTVRWIKDNRWVLERA